MPDSTALDSLLAEIASSVSPEGTPLALPPRAYTDEALFALERERVIGPGWWCVGRAASWSEPGSYRTIEIAGDRLDVQPSLAGTSAQPLKSAEVK